MSADFWPWPPHLPSKEAEAEEGAHGIALSVPKSAEKCSIYRISTVNVARALTFEIFFFVVDAGMSALLSRKGDLVCIHENMYARACKVCRNTQVSKGTKKRPINAQKRPTK